MRKVFLIFLSVIVFHAFSQNTADTVVYAEGKILNGETKQPVVAHITYQSLPYGNRIGVINGDSYSFPLFDGDKYSITVEAAGFTTARYMVDPALAADGKIIKDIELAAGHVTNTHIVGHVMRLNNLIFQKGKSRVSPESHPELNLVVKMMNENRNMVIQLEGHTDYQGDARENLKLSQERVDAVKGYLVSQGIHKKRIRTKAYGGTLPLSKDNTAEAHALNRRVELRILEN